MDLPTMFSLTPYAVIVGPRRRPYGEGLLPVPPSATHAGYTSNLATSLALLISRGRAHYQRPKPQVGNEATRHQ